MYELNSYILFRRNSVSKGLRRCPQVTGEIRVTKNILCYFVSDRKPIIDDLVVSRCHRHKPIISLYFSGAIDSNSSLAG
jgi:hypothetical protein